MGCRQLLCLLALCNVVHGATPASTLADSSKDTVHIVFSNHLDVGFGGIPPELGIDNTIINKYFQWYFPLAIRLGEYFDTHDGPESHVYTAHSFVVSLYLSCPPNMGLACPSKHEQKAFQEAAKKGHITWTALPWNAQIEMMDPLMLESAVHLTNYLDDDVGVPHKTVMSQRDVPGLTRAALNVLSQSGVRAISVGVNSGSAPPGVPKNAPFVWRDEASGAQVIAFWHPYGYGGHTVDDGGRVYQLTPADDCVKTPRRPDGSRDVLCFSWRGDNSGPHGDPADILAIFNEARAAWPGAAIKASTFEAFLDALEPFGPDLEVVTGEIGDTWIHGVASDPVKIQQYRAIMRMRSQCIYSESCTKQDPAFRNFTRLLLKLPEHTWGIDTKAAPASYDVWANDDFRAARKDNELFAIAEHSWLRQTQYIAWSMEALHTQKATAALAAAMATTLAGLSELHPAEHRVDSGELQLRSCAPKAATRPAPDGRAAARRLAAAAYVKEGPQALGGLQRGGEAAAAAGPLCEDAVLETDMWYIRVDSASGQIASLRRKWTGADGEPVHGTDWAANGAFGEILYRTYSEQYFVDWDSGYNPGGNKACVGGWMYDFGKPNMDSAKATYSTARPEFVGAAVEEGPFPGEQVLVVRYQFSGWPVDEAGAPPQMSLLLRVWKGSNSVMLDVMYRGKQPTRIAEGLWVRFAPDKDVVKAEGMQLAKIDGLISPSEVMRNGSHNLHALSDGGVHLPSSHNDWESLQVVGLDTALVAVGQPEVVPDVTGPARPEEGFNFCLNNNAWGTNYVMWTPYGDDGVGAKMKFRFVVTVRDARSGMEPHWLLAADEHFGGMPRELIT